MATIRESGGALRISGSLLSISPVMWRRRLREASFRGAPFHVEQQGRTSGRRTVVHQYPKMDAGSPYAEDMGREARRYQITGYVIQKFPGMLPRNSEFSINYDIARDRLIEALEGFGPAVLVDPYNNRVGPNLFQCERYGMTESRERGGYAQFDMTFVEQGAAQSFPGVDTASQIAQAAQDGTLSAASILNTQQLRYFELATRQPTLVSTIPTP